MVLHLALLALTTKDLAVHRHREKVVAHMVKVDSSLFLKLKIFGLLESSSSSESTEEYGDIEEKISELSKRPEFLSG